jgi:hypothetical protein
VMLVMPGAIWPSMHQVGCSQNHKLWLPDICASVIVRWFMRLAGLKSGTSMHGCS